jgi:hypothetical protein
MLQIIAAASKNGDIETLFINTVEAGARLMLEAADAVREAGSRPDRERINALIQCMTRVHGFCNNTYRTLDLNLDCLSSAIRLVEADDIVDDFDTSEMFNKDKELLTMKPTMFSFDPKEGTNDGQQ